jgi:hypothetical protein
MTTLVCDLLGTALARKTQPAADIVAELTSRR